MTATDQDLTDAIRGILACPEQAISLIGEEGATVSEQELRLHPGVGISS